MVLKWVCKRIKVHFTYDALGRITREQTGDDIVEFNYDELNNLSRLTLPQGDSLNWLYYGSGHATAINHLIDGRSQLITEFDRDDLHREISRTQGALTQYRQYDKLGRTISTFSSRDKQHPLNGITLWRKWFYDPQDNLGAMEDTYRGWVEYLYDSEQRLKKVASSENLDAMLFYDRADNLLERPQSEIDAEHSPTLALSPQGDKLHQFQGWHYQYDAYGNVIARRYRNQSPQTYAYDGDNRLVIAHNQGIKAQYHYDALGRRIHKTVENRESGQVKRQETHFIWQGLRLLQEQDINTGKHQTYCYEEHGSYTPLAVIVKQSSGFHYYWHHCDINSAPLEVTNAQGNTLWSGKYERFGFVRNSPLSFYSDPERVMESFEQNLRYAGQYFDNETGLHFNTFRFYDPQIGRFIMPDPIGLLGGMNLYAYAPNPLVWIDPLGLMILYRGMNIAEYDELMKTGKWTSPPSTLEGKWFAESYKDAVTWGEKMGHGGDFRVVQVNVPDHIADAAYKNPRLDGIGKARFIENAVLNDAGIKPRWSKYIHQPTC